jgi:hypothetical protein
LALVEPLDDGSPEPHQLPAEAVRPGLRRGLDELERLEAAQQAVRGRARLFEKLGQAAWRRLALLGQLLEQVDGLRERANRVLANLVLAILNPLRRHLPPPVRILDRLSA